MVPIGGARDADHGGGSSERQEATAMCKAMPPDGESDERVDGAATTGADGGRRFSTVARAVIVSKRRLLLARYLREDYLFLPGGHIEWGEAALSCIRRELREELADPPPEPIACRFAGVVEHVWFSDQGSDHEINLVWRLHWPDAASDRPFESAESHLAFEWHDEVATLDLRPESLKPQLEALAQDTANEPFHICDIERRCRAAPLRSRSA